MVFDLSKTYQFSKDLFCTERGITVEESSFESRWIREVENIIFTPNSEHYACIGEILVLPEWCIEAEQSVVMELTQEEIGYIIKCVTEVVNNDTTLSDNENINMQKLIKKMEEIKK